MLGNARSRALAYAPTIFVSNLTLAAKYIHEHEIDSMEL